MKIWRIPEMWKDGSAWIIGGGISVMHQLGVPRETIDQVLSGEKGLDAYLPYFEPLYDKNVIGVNAGFLLGDFISVLYYCDRQFFRVFWRKIIQFKNLKVTDCGSIDRPLRHLSLNVKRMNRDSRNMGLSTDPHVVRWNHSSGAAAINFATLAGAKKIYLLGFDMKADGQGRTHWHRTNTPVYARPTNEEAFNNFLRTFPIIKRDADKMGVEIINVNPDSALDVFEKVSFQEVINEKEIRLAG